MLKRPNIVHRPPQEHKKAVNVREITLSTCRHVWRRPESFQNVGVLKWFFFTSIHVLEYTVTH